MFLFAVGWGLQMENVWRDICADVNYSPHPSAPDKPPFETIVGLMSAPIDKVMDMFAKFPSEEDKQKAKS